MKKQLLTLVSLVTLTTSTNAQLNFAPAVNYGTGPNPSSVCSADFNGDGKADLATANYGGNNLSILLGSGTGTFAPAVNYGTGPNPSSVCSADFNGDGKADLAVANFGGNNISILLGSGTGTFAAAVNYVAGTNPSSVFSADFNGDGKADLAAANASGSNVSILLGSGTGTFTPAVNYGAGSAPQSVFSADFNGDGKADLAVASSGSNNISILLGSGTGTFAAAVNYTTGTTPISVFSADFNGDGKADLASANYNASNVSILLGSGTGTFAAAVNYSVGAAPLSVFSADFNGDGKADLATANQTSNNVSILLGSGTGTFAAAVNYGMGTSPISVSSADFNGDGKADLATANQTSNDASILLNTSIPPAAALNFDGFDDLVNLGTAITDSLSGSNKITAEAWVNPSTLSGVATIHGNHNTTGNNMMQYILRRNGSGWEFYIGTGSGGAYTGLSTAPNTATVGVWQHVAGTWDGTIARIYLNGVLSATASITYVSMGTFSNPAWIGRVSSTTESWNGGIDEVRVWKRVLCQGEIQNNMLGQITLPQTNLLAYYQFNQGIAASTNTSETSLIPLAGSTGTLQNFALTTGTISNWVSPGGVVSGNTVSVFVSPTIAIAGASVICSGASTTFTASGANSYTWLGGPTTATFAVSPTVATTYSVVGIASNGCASSMATQTINVNTTPTISVNNGAICSGNSFTISPSGAISYTISGGSAVVSPTTNASYSVTGISPQGCVSSNTAVSTVTVNSLPVVMAATNSTLLCSGQTASLTASGATSYTWNTSATTTVIAVSPTTTVTYTVNGTDANGCSNAATVTQSVSACTGIATLSNDAAIKLYPNPTNGLFTLELNTTSQVSVTNALGEVVIIETLNAGKHNLDIHNQATGVYFVKVIENNKQQIIKVIKQ